MAMAKVAVLPEISQNAYAGKFHDRSPNIRAAGIMNSANEENVADCIQLHERPETPDVIKRFHATSSPPVGERTIHYGKAFDPHLHTATQMCHGVKGLREGSNAADLLNPRPLTTYEQRFMERLEAQYQSHRRAPLGKVPAAGAVCLAPLNELPYDPQSTTFGIKSVKVDSASEALNPEISPVDVQNQECKDHDIYLKSHKHFIPGEQVIRGYNDRFNRLYRYGAPTPNFPDGRNVRATLEWLADVKAKKQTPIVAKRLDDLRAKSQPELGKTLDPIADTMRVGPDHTYGLIGQAETYGVDDLLHGRVPRHLPLTAANGSPDRADEGMTGSDLGREAAVRSLLCAVRRALFSDAYRAPPYLLDVCRSFDAENSGRLPASELRAVLQKFAVPLDSTLLEPLMDLCDVGGNGGVDYAAFLKFLKWDNINPRKHERDLWSAPTTREARRLLSARSLQERIDANPMGWQTSSSLHNENMHQIRTNTYRAFGVPTVRTDLPIPKFRRTSDRTTFGDEGDACGVLNPNVPAQRGVYQVDLRLGRTKDQMRTIFEPMMSEESEFNALWESTTKLERIGACDEEMACVDEFNKVFRAAEDEKIAKRHIVAL